MLTVGACRRLPAGLYRLRVLRIGYPMLNDTVTIHGGIADTVRRILNWA